MGFALAFYLLALTAFRNGVSALYLPAGIRKTKSVENNRFSQSHDQSARIALFDDYIYDFDMDDERGKNNFWNSMLDMMKKIWANKMKFEKIRKEYTLDKRKSRENGKGDNTNKPAGRSGYKRTVRRQQENLNQLMQMMMTAALVNQAPITIADNTKPQRRRRLVHQQHGTTAFYPYF